MSLGIFIGRILFPRIRDFFSLGIFWVSGFFESRDFWVSGFWSPNSGFLSLGILIPKFGIFWVSGFFRDFLSSGYPDFFYFWDRDFFLEWDIPTKSQLCPISRFLPNSYFLIFKIRFRKNKESIFKKLNLIKGTLEALLLS